MNNTTIGRLSKHIQIQGLFNLLLRFLPLEWKSNQQGIETFYEHLQQDRKHQDFYQQFHIINQKQETCTCGTIHNINHEKNHFITCSIPINQLYKHDEIDLQTQLTKQESYKVTDQYCIACNTKQTVLFTNKRILPKLLFVAIARLV